MELFQLVVLVLVEDQIELPILQQLLLMPTRATTQVQQQDTQVQRQLQHLQPQQLQPHLVFVK